MAPLAPLATPMKTITDYFTSGSKTKARSSKPIAKTKKQQSLSS